MGGSLPVGLFAVVVLLVFFSGRELDPGIGWDRLRIVSPFNRATRFHVPPTFAAVPAPTDKAPERGKIEPVGVIR